MYLDRRRFVGAALATTISLALARPPERRKSELVRTYERAIVLDTLMPATPDFDVEVALRAGLTGGVIDLSYPRTTPHALEAIAQWDVAFADPGRRFLHVRKAGDFALCRDACRMPRSVRRQTQQVRQGDPRLGREGGLSGHLQYDTVDDRTSDIVRR
jgi:hypothetical protein